MTGAIIIQQETTDNFEEVFEVNLNAFGQAKEARLVEALRNNATVFVPALSLVAMYNNQIVGHILFTRVKIKDDNGNHYESLALAPLAVRPEMQKKGIGGQLIRKGFEIAKESGFNAVIVLGHKSYYQKFGFVRAEKWNIKAPFKLSDNGNFMAIELVGGALTNISGTVIYPKEFETV